MDILMDILWVEANQEYPHPSKLELLVEELGMQFWAYQEHPPSCNFS